MIRYALRCPLDHEFEAWFSSSSGFDDQVTRGLVECPMCGSTAITKAIMAPQIRTSKTDDGLAGARKLSEMMHALRRHVETTHDYVGSSFASVARDMHEGVKAERPIYGEATGEEVKALIDDGVPVAPLPVFNLPTDEAPKPALPTQRLSGPSAGRKPN